MKPALIECGKIQLGIPGVLIVNPDNSGKHLSRRSFNHWGQIQRRSTL